MMILRSWAVVLMALFLIGLSTVSPAAPLIRQSQGRLVQGLAVIEHGVYQNLVPVDQLDVRTVAKRLQESELENRRLTGELVRLRHVETQYQALVAQYASVSGVVSRMIPVVAAPLLQSSVLFAGKQNGVVVGSSVSTQGVLYGRVTAVEDDRAWVSTVYAPSAPIGMVHVPSGKQAMLTLERGIVVAKFFTLVTVNQGDSFVAIPGVAGEPSFPVAVARETVSKAADPLTLVRVEPLATRTPDTVFVGIPQ